MQKVPGRISWFPGFKEMSSGQKKPLIETYKEIIEDYWRKTE